MSGAVYSNLTEYNNLKKNSNKKHINNMYR